MTSDLFFPGKKCITPYDITIRGKLVDKAKYPKEGFLLGTVFWQYGIDYRLGAKNVLSLWGVEQK